MSCLTTDTEAAKGLRRLQGILLATMEPCTKEFYPPNGVFIDLSITQYSFRIVTNCCCSITPHKHPNKLIVGTYNATLYSLKTLARLLVK